MTRKSFDDLISVFDEYAPNPDDAEEMDGWRRVSEQLEKRLAENEDDLEEFCAVVWELSGEWLTLASALLWRLADRYPDNIVEFHEALFEHPIESEEDEDDDDEDAEDEDEDADAEDEDEDRPVASIQSLKKKLRLDPYGVFLDAKRALPVAKEPKAYLKVLIDALKLIEEDVEEHDTSNFNSYFEQTEEDEPTYDELWGYQEHYAQLLEQIEAGTTPDTAALELTIHPEDQPGYEIVDDDTVPVTEHLRYLGSLWKVVPDGHRDSVRSSFDEALRPFRDHPHPVIRLHALEAGADKVDTKELAYALIACGEQFFEAEETWEWRVVSERLPAMKEFGDVVRGWIGEQVAEYGTTDVRQFLELSLELPLDFKVDHPKARKSTLTGAKKAGWTAYEPTRRLRYFNGEEVVSQLVANLDNKESAVAREAIESLGYFEGAEVIAVIADKLSSKDGQHVAAAIGSLARIGTPEARAHLTPDLHRHITDSIDDYGHWCQDILTTALLLFDEKDTP